ncbi:SurA N-terminal domain-containing protein [Saccharopolyspora gloriosae]|uniref:SurA N-terminal domain-containing protein n=1 Tax=Saccharopolyspora gloriosae TaxID=455344 RepID=UPI001FB6C6E8|nr:SurA N-terminal domain-containing protein [Saccharopolyspora gloriosae]
MSSVIARLRPFALVALSCALLAGCGFEPGRAGAAALVGDARIPVSEVQSRYRAVLDKEPEAKAQLEEQDQLGEFGRRLAGDLTRRALVDQVAEDEGLRVDERRVREVIDAAGGAEKASAGQIYTADDMADVVRSRLLTAELGRRYIDRLSVTYDVTSATTREDAEQKARRMARGDAESAAVVTADQQAGQGAATDQRLRSAEVPDLAAGTPLFGARPGTTMAFELQPQSGQWTVVRIKRRDVAPPPPAPSPAGGDEMRMQSFGDQLLRVTAQRVGVELSPRYGAWDQLAMSAAPNKDETIGFVFPAVERS